MVLARFGLVLLLTVSAAAQQRVLVPVAYNGFGAFRSSWITQAGGWNRTDATWRSPGLVFIVMEGCVIPEGCPADELEPGQAAILGTEPSFYKGFNAPTGFLVRLPDAETGRAAITVRFGHGTPLHEMPTPHESEFTTGPIFLPLTLAGGFPVRTLLRVYALDVTREVTVRVVARPALNPSSTLVRTATVTVRPQEGRVPGTLPGYGELPLNGIFGSSFGSADIELVQEPDAGGAPAARLWAFATVTHTETNVVSLVTPR